MKGDRLLPTPGECQFCKWDGQSEETDYANNEKAWLDERRTVCNSPNCVRALQQSMRRARKMRDLELQEMVSPIRQRWIKAKKKVKAQRNAIRRGHRKAKGRAA